MAALEYPRAAATYFKAFEAAWNVNCSHRLDRSAFDGEPCDNSALWCILMVDAFQAAAGLSLAYVAIKEWHHALIATMAALTISDIKFWWPHLAISEEDDNAILERRRMLRLKLNSSSLSSSR